MIDRILRLTKHVGIVIMNITDFNTTVSFRGDRMKSSKKRVLSLLLLVALAIPMLAGNAFAASDVTASMKKKSGVVKLA